MSRFKKILAGQVLLILLAAGALSYVDSITDLKLGLDLKGGTQLDYLLDLSSVSNEDQSQIVEGVQEVIRKRVDSLGVSEPNIYVSNIADEYHIIVELAGISDINEAKETVGKTIQLEFREENTEPSDEQVNWAADESNKFYASIKSGADFKTLAEPLAKENVLDVLFTETQLTSIDELSESLQGVIADKNIGDVVGPVELDEGYVIDSDQNIRESRGQAVIQITDKKTEETTAEANAEVSANHILISYEGAERSSAERSKEEAESLAKDLLARIENGESFGDIAKEYSDDPGSGAKGGDLGSFGRGVMTQTFEDAAFALEIGGISEIVETEFGFHIIEVYDKIEPTTETVTTTKYAFNKIVFSTTPSPWKEESVLTGEHFKHADVQFNDAYQPYVSITFSKEGGDLFETLTENNVGKRIAIFVGGNLISAPTVQSVIAGGTAQITGNFSLEEAQELARDLNTGAIPAPIELVGQYTISATLGAEALNQSIYAGIIGLIILALYMLLYYRIPGLIANLALAIYAILLIFLIKIALPTAIALLLGLALFIYMVHLILKSRDSGGEKFISFILACVVLFFMTFVMSSPVTLTLAGIAGVILSIGMAVDANVLIFERMKEELLDGKDLDQAINDGFNRAWDSIRDSNFSSLITCAILFYFGSSIIRGFALNLALGILISMFSAIMLTKTFLKFTAESKLRNNLWLFNKPKKERKKALEIIKNTKIWATFSGVLLTIAIISTVTIGMNLGLDFTGGTLMEVNLGSDEVTADAIENDVYEVEQAIQGDFGSPQVVSTDQGTFIIRLKHLSEDEHDAITSKFEEKYQSVEEVRFTTVGPTVGKTLKSKAIIAIFITLIFIVLYISFAFRKIPKEVSPWRFGVSAIAALVHDILVVLGVFILLGHYMGVEIDALFITALLTIMGFSVHDTIVVFDRIRENLIFRENNETLAETANKALNQTMARSINTSISTLITILALLFFGADSIKMFVLALTVGIIAGTYSSIFVASPLLVWWNTRANK